MLRRSHSDLQGLSRVIAKFMMAGITEAEADSLFASGRDGEMLVNNFLKLQRGWAVWLLQIFFPNFKSIVCEIAF